MQDAERFHRVFLGAETYYGTYTSEEIGLSGKAEIKKTARTVRENVTNVLWERHLAGIRSLGISPISEDNSCLWGAVDIDDYTVDQSALADRLLKARIPAIVCRTKSGGAHVYIFLTEPVPAAQLISRLRELAAFLGHGGSEIFPKQEQVLHERGDLGTWINMPYFGGDNTARYAVLPDGRGLSVGEFLRAAEQSKISPETLDSLVLREVVPEFAAGPPCLEALVRQGFPNGTRNNGLLALGVLAKKMDADEWETLLKDWNQKYMHPPLGTDEVRAVVKSLRRKDYHYKCRDQPIVSYCNVPVCRTRPHGVSDGGDASIVESVSILDTEPPVFFVILKTGGTVEVSASQLLSSHEFQQATLAQILQVIPEYPRNVWIRIIEASVAAAVKIEAPKEVSVTGKFMELVEQFVQDRYRADVPEDILLGKPWHNEEDGNVYFRLMDLETALDKQRFMAPNRRGTLRTWMASRLRELGGNQQQLTLRGRNVSVWVLSSGLFVWDSPPASIPVAEESPI